MHGEVIDQGAVLVEVRPGLTDPTASDVSPLVDAIRKRVGAALEQSEKLDALVSRERDLDRQSRKSPN